MLPDPIAYFSTMLQIAYGGWSCVHPFHPFSARCGSQERVREVLCFPRNLGANELHNAHGIKRLGVIGQNEFGDPKIAAADGSPDCKLLFIRLTGALALYIASAAGALEIGRAHV